MNHQNLARVLVLLSILALILTQGPCAFGGRLVDEDLKTGERLEKRAEYQKSAEAYARALRLEPGNKQARNGLSRVAGIAIAERLSSARSLEESLRFSDARTELSAAVALQDRVRAGGITLPDNLDAAAAYTGMIDRWVEHLYGEALNTQGDDLWSAAVAHLRAIETLRPDYRDVRARLAAVWTAWGNRDLELHLYRSAAGRFLEASQVPGNGSAPAAGKAAEILTDLGLHALEKGACRSAVRDLRAAAESAPDAVPPDTLAAAESCALTCLSLAVGSHRDLEMESARLEAIGAELRNLIANRGSVFLTVIHRGSNRESPCDVRPPGGKPDANTAATPRRIRAAVEVTSQVLLRSPATSRNSEFRSQQMIGGQIVGESVTVIRVYDEVFTGSMTGTITLTDQKTGRTGLTIPVRVRGETSAQWVKNPTTIVATGTAIRSTGIADRPTLDRLARIDDQRIEARSRLKDDLARDFVTEAVRIILETSDAEPEISDPASMELSFVKPPADGPDARETR